MKSLCCNSDLVFRDKQHPYSKRDLPKGSREMLLKCSVCGAKHQAREGDFSHPYQTKKKSTVETKTKMIVHRFLPSRVSDIEAEWPSLSFYLDNAPIPKYNQANV